MQLTINPFPDDLSNILKQQAAQFGMSKSAYIKYLLTEDVKRNANKTRFSVKRREPKVTV
jgi:plasmid stability protein